MPLLVPFLRNLDFPPRLGCFCRSLLAMALSWVALQHHAKGEDVQETAKRPNVLFIFSDDHACEAIGAYGSTLDKTPHLDRIAKEGILFRNSFCANSICGPSRACILTGKHSHKNGFLRNGNRFDGTQWTFPKTIQTKGYRTAMIGKWHLSSDPTGFDYWDILPGQGHYYNPVFLTEGNQRTTYEGYVTDIITQKAIGWLKEHQQKSSDQPFFMMCQHKAPHRNWSPPIRHLRRFDGRDIAVPDSLEDTYQGRSKLLQENEMSLAKHFSWSHDAKFVGENLAPEYFTSRPKKNGEYTRMNDAQRQAWDEHYEPQNKKFISELKSGKLSPKDVLEWKYQRYIKDYLGCIAAVDDSVGELLRYLDDEGLAEDTIVIYSSDQGFYLGQHGWYDKRWMFEPSLKMPLMMRWPGKIKAGLVSEALVQNIDYAPTFLDVTNTVGSLEGESEIQGRSLLPLMLKPEKTVPADWRKELYYAYYENGSVHNVPAHDGVRTADLKLMFFPRTKEYQLFDLKTDPNEMKSVHDDSNYAQRFMTMKQRLVEMRHYYDLNSAAVPLTRRDEAWWAKRFDEKRTLAAKGKAKIAFVGDSITQGWEGRGSKYWQEHFSDQSINLGFSGDRTEHVIWRLKNRGFGKLRPEQIVLMIGTNNTGHRLQDPDEVAEGIKVIIEELQRLSPKSKIVLHAIFPRGIDNDDPQRVNNDAINRRIRKFADGKKVVWLDFSERFLNSDGTLPLELMPDRLHLSEKGYEIWTDELLKILNMNSRDLEASSAR